MNYYNEFDPFAAAWLRELIKAGEIPNGIVDERSITEVKASDLKGFTQCHFFAGIGGWSKALRLAGWPDDKSVWSGSCPCQPFSTAGKQKGKSDERHLWPVWFELIRQSKPEFVFGEQVPAAIRHGWWDDVADDLEGEGYATRAEIRPACSIGSPHKRDRLWFVGHAKYNGSYGTKINGSDDAPIQHNTQGKNSPSEFTGASRSGDVANTDNGALPNATDSGLSQWQSQTLGASGQPEFERFGGGDIEWIDCADGKKRLTKSGLGLLANGVSNRVGKLRGYGNAIVPQVAAEFIKAVTV